MPCYIIKMKSGAKAFMCGDIGPHCSHCADVGEYLCDYPVGDGKTCDASLCENHASEAAPNIHYCPGHALMWNEFRESGGVKQELQNVIPWRSNGKTEAGK